jgi:hypothetical protein
MLRASVLALAACGRVGFDARPANDAAPDVAAADAAHDAALAAIAYVQPFAARHPGAGATDTFTTAAAHTGDTIVIEVACSDATAPSAVSLTAPGWTFTPLDAVAGAASTQLYAASFVATAPDAAMVTVTVTWTGSTCQVGKAELGDELANVATVDAHVLVPGTGACGGGVVTGHANDAVWGACFDATSITGVGPGYAKGADNGGGDWSEYKLTTDPAGTLEQVTFASPAVGFVLAAATLAP